jgi:hypothetical protein
MLVRTAHSEPIRIIIVASARIALATAQRFIYGGAARVFITGTNPNSTRHLVSSPLSYVMRPTC